jgi:hypothetical protein
MRSPTTIPRPAIFGLTWPISLAEAVLHLPESDRASAWRQLRDRLCGMAVIALVLATLVMACVLAVVELAPQPNPAMAAGQPPAVSTLERSAAGARPVGQAWDERTPKLPDPRNIDPTALTLVATVVNLLIFVALGLYMRWDAGRKD